MESKVTSISLSLSPSTCTWQRQFMKQQQQKSLLFCVKSLYLLIFPFPFHLYYYYFFNFKGFHYLHENIDITHFVMKWDYIKPSNPTFIFHKKKKKTEIFNVRVWQYFGSSSDIWLLFFFFFHLQNKCGILKR